MPLPLTPFYFIRHGQSVTNAAGIMAGGGTDAPLTDFGRSQAVAAATVLAKQKIRPAAIISSPMQRALDTASIINQALDLPLQSLEDLREHCVGAWEGKPWPEVQKLWDQGILDAPGGETWLEFQQRVKRGMQQSLAQPGPVLVVAHGGVWAAMKGLYGLEVGMHLDNAIPHFYEPQPDRALLPWQLSRLSLCSITGDAKAELVDLF